MKNLCLLIFFLFLNGYGYSQFTYPIDMEGTYSGSPPEQFNGFGGTNTTVVDNPNPTGQNLSNKVLRIDKGPEIWAGMEFRNAVPVPVGSFGPTGTAPYVCFDYYTTAPANGYQIVFKYHPFTDMYQEATVSGEWGQVCYTPPVGSEGSDWPVIIFRNGTGGNTSDPDFTLFVDNINLYATPPPVFIPPGILSLPIDFEGDDFAGNPIDDDVFGVNSGGFDNGVVVANGFDDGAGTVETITPSVGNPSTKVGQIVRHAGSTTAGAYIDLPEALVLDLDPIICMNVFTEADVETPIILRIEDSNNSSIFMQDTALTTVSGGWDTLCFVFHNAPPTCDRLTFLFDLGNPGNGSAASTFLFDDIYQPLTPSGSTIFFTPGSQFFCPPSSFELSYPGTGPYEWFESLPATGTPDGTGDTYPTGTLNQTTPFWVRDMATSGTIVGTQSAGPPSTLGQAAEITGNASVFFTSNINNGYWRGVDIIRKWIGAVGANCTYTVTGRNLTLDPGPFPYLAGTFSTIVVNIPTSSTDNSPFTTLFPNFAVPMNVGDEMKLEVNVSGNGCRLRAFVLGGPIIPGYPTTTSGGELTFTGYETPFDPTFTNTRWMGFNYRVSGDIIADPTLHQVNAIADCANPLPIELLDFTVNEDKGDALLRWSTASELNNDRFLLMRTIDGISFETVGIVSGAGNSSTVLHYSFRDRNPLKGLSYYMLKQVDFDGTESDSELVAFTNKSTAGFQLFPNPTSQELTLMLGEGYDNIEVRVYDLTGRLINQHSFGSADILSFELTGNPGTYFVEVLVDEERRETFNVMKL